MKTQFILFLLFMSLGGCEGQSRKSTDRVASNDQPESFDYVFSNDSLRQEVKVVFKSMDQILFTLTTVNTKRNAKSTFSGTASMKNQPGADTVQAYEDELESDMYPAKEYVYEKSCYFTIGIESKTNSRLFVTEAMDCGSLHRRDCPFGSLGTLRRK